MSVCRTCNTEGARIRTRWMEDVQVDECPSCAPASFEKFTAPSDKKMWMGYEAHPNEYVKAADGGYDRKPEFRSEQEEKLSQPTAEEQEAQARAAQHKRAHRRLEPMTPSELVAAIRKAEQIAEWIGMGANEGRDVN